eukprot:NODE_16571_length_987_cov_5.793023.p6 GENE.NODE_16571_length_987_cov_5.793023~~NODE_16571_length_987_cov_5.793023.p6  ORF type:complete len:85 (-),score=49.54 NODE_16571_length_987_cov_5.793023:76-330(-)
MVDQPVPFQAMTWRAGRWHGDERPTDGPQLTHPSCLEVTVVNNCSDDKKKKKKKKKKRTKKKKKKKKKKTPPTLKKKKHKNTKN